MTERRSESSLAQVKSKIKVVFLGDQSAGKTSILLRFMHSKFEEGQAATVGIDFMAKNIVIGGTTLRLQLWDTAGQERFRSLIPSYLKDATVTFIVFDITNKRSFNNTREWIQLCVQNRRQKSIMYLVGNKSDLKAEREVSQKEAEEKAENEGIRYFEVSAKQDVNIKQIFQQAGKDYVDQSFNNETTIGNIENLHEGYLNKMGQRQQQENHENPIQLKKEEQGGKKKDKKGCC